MSHSDDLVARIENLIQENIDQFLKHDEEHLLRIKVEDIRRQNLCSNRFGGLCTVEYWNSNQELVKRVYWIKRVEDPERFFAELSSVYNSLERAGLHSNMTKPYLFDLDSSVVCISHFSGSSLLKETLRHLLSLHRSMPQQLIESYYDIGKWLQQYHEVMASAETMMSMADILVLLCDALERDSYFDWEGKGILMRHIDGIRDSAIGDLTFVLVRTHNDFTLRNILLSDTGFGIIDWDAMVHPKFPDRAPVWNELSCFLLNLQSMLRFYPLISRSNIHKLQWSFLDGYFDKSTLAKDENFLELFFVFTLRFFFGIDSDRPLSQIYRPRLGRRYLRFLEKSLLQGSADIT